MVTNEPGSIIFATYSNYNALGQYGQVAFSNGVTTTYEYRTDSNRLESILTNSSTAGDLIDLTYDFDNAGNITGIIDDVQSEESKTYIYDELNRLVDAGSISYGGSITYEYDEIGNMTYNSRYGTYSYNDPDHVHAATQAGADSYTYDDNGNMISRESMTLNYDYDNRVESITNGGAAIMFTYDAGGQRVKKVLPGSETVYIGDIFECTDGVCAKYIFAGSQRIAKIRNGNGFYYHTDHLGSSSVITDSMGMEEQGIYYYPYGEIKTNTGSDVSKYKFTDQEWDAESGLYYYGARYYDPKLARFISADTIVPRPFNPQALNRYSYVINNPVKYIDPSGHDFGLSALVVSAFVSMWVSGVTGQGDPVEAAIIGAVSYGTFQGVSTAMPTTYSSTTVNVTASTAAGASGGATGAALNGGNIIEGAAMGAGAGAFGGYMGQFGGKYAGLVQIGSSALSGGVMADLNGGSFSKGFVSSGIAATASMAAKSFFERNTKVDASDESNWWEENMNRELKLV